MPYAGDDVAHAMIAGAVERRQNRLSIFNADHTVMAQSCRFNFSAESWNGLKLRSVPLQDSLQAAFENVAHHHSC